MRPDVRIRNVLIIPTVGTRFGLPTNCTSTRLFLRWWPLSMIFWSNLSLIFGNENADYKEQNGGIRIFERSACPTVEP